jgi:hypothetical protein
MMALWLFASKADSGVVANSWTWPHPLSGALRQRTEKKIRNKVLNTYMRKTEEKKTILINLQVDLESILSFTKSESFVDGKMSISEILVLRVEGGSDVYITVDARLNCTCIGRSISQLCAMSNAARKHDSVCYIIFFIGHAVNLLY